MKRFIILIVILCTLITQFVRADENLLNNKVKIALIDTGVVRKTLKKDQLETGYNYVFMNKDTDDKIGHGTSIAGIICGSSAIDMKGIYEEAIIVPLVIQTKEMNGMEKKVDVSSIARAIKDAIDRYNCRVINLSIGIDAGNKTILDAVKYAESKNVLIIASVGNKESKNSEHIYYPAAYQTVIGVGSVDKNGYVSAFSQKNKSVKLVALGENIWTVSRNGKPLMVSGTSFATANVTEVVAKILSGFPELTAKDIRDILYKSATDIYEKGYDTKSGYGILNADQAMDFAKDRAVKVSNN